MATEAREYPVRIHAGHLGGGRRIWKPELVDQHEAAHTCKYVRGDVAADMLEAVKAMLEMYGPPLTSIDYPDSHPISLARAAITKAEAPK